jgi:SAM-dependent methyltransferase
MWCRTDELRARRRWQQAIGRGPLDIAQLPSLASRFPLAASTYNYSADDVRERGLERCRELAPYAPAGSATLEVGSADGMTACALAEQGRVATAIDIDTSRTDPRVIAAGVQVIQMDATRLQFPAASFDLVYSFNVFEHLPNPAATFAEVTRVLRPGGVAYIRFTGLRWSPHGAHLYKMIGVPYVTVLFDEADVMAYLRGRGDTGYAPWVNACSIEQFRAAFRDQARAYGSWRYDESRNRWHTSLIAEYAGVFKGRAPSFDSLLADSVHVCGRKRAHT